VLHILTLEGHRNACQTNTSHQDAWNHNHHVNAESASYRIIHHILLYTVEYAPTSRDRQLELLDTPSLTSAILAVVCGRLVVLAHVHTHVVEVVEAPLLRDPLRGLAVFCDQTEQISSALLFNLMYATSS